MAEIKSGNYEAAFNELKPLAEQGDPIAQINLGRLYDHGNGTTKNPSLAAEWYLKAANQGNADAQYNVGSMYETGDGLPQSLTNAASWYLKAANQGNAKSQTAIAMLYYLGEGIPQDINKAKEWYLKAATQGFAEAQLGLSGILLSEDDNETSSKEAAEWALKAANQGLIPAQEIIGKLYILGIGVPKDIRQGNYWLTKAATKNTDAPSPPISQSQPNTTLAKPTATNNFKLDELNRKASKLWSDLNAFRYNSNFHRYAFMQGSKPGGEWHSEQKALWDECKTYRDKSPTEIKGLFDLCVSISDMWLVGADWAGNNGGNTRETIGMITKIENALRNSKTAIPLSLVRVAAPAPKEEVIGSWLSNYWDTEVKITAYQKGGVVYMKKFSSQPADEMEADVLNGKVKLHIKDGKEDEYYLINSEGNLEFWSNSGNYYTAKKL